jgi:hypothetical protein
VAGLATPQVAAALNTRLFGVSGGVPDTALVLAYNEHFLGHLPNSAVFQASLRKLRQGGARELIAFLAGSDEYFARVAP